MRADWLFLLTDVDALYTSNPITNRDAQPIHTVHDIGQLQVMRKDMLLEYGMPLLPSSLFALQSFQMYIAMNFVVKDRK